MMLHRHFEQNKANTEPPKSEEKVTSEVVVDEAAPKRRGRQKKSETDE